MADLTDDARQGLEIMLEKLRAAGQTIPASNVYILDTGAGQVLIDLEQGKITEA